MHPKTYNGGSNPTWRASTATKKWQSNTNNHSLWCKLNHTDKDPVDTEADAAKIKNDTIYSRHNPKRDLNIILEHHSIMRHRNPIVGTVGKRNRDLIHNYLTRK